MAFAFDQTYPSDYRAFFSGPQLPTIAGGQAVNLWALHFLTSSEADLKPADLGSHDLDVVLVDKSTIDYFRTLPGWTFKPRDFRNFADNRQGSFLSISADGRRLLVEILHSVHGLDRTDLAHSVVLDFEGAEFRVLDAVAMLKAKAANVSDIDQDGDPPRHDRQHLSLISRCVPLFLRQIHQLALEGRLTEKDALAALSRTFKILQHSKTAKTLAKEGITPAAIVPPDFANSPLDRIRRAFDHQMKIAESAPFQR